MGKALGTHPIGVKDSFFDLGGDSLMAVALMLEMERAGLDPTVAHSIMRGSTIEELAGSNKMDERSAEPNRQPLRLPEAQRMSLHVMRGVLVLLLIAGHWLPGLLERVSLPAGTKEFLTPLLNIGTPGFAITFGIGLGFYSYNLQNIRPSLARKQLFLGQALLAGAMVLSAAFEIVEAFADSTPVTGHFLAMQFYNVLGFYFIALLTVPMWFWAIRHSEPTVMVGVLGLLALFIALDMLTRWLFLPYEPTGLVQLARLYATAKFSYFILGIGVIIGLGIGLYLRGTAVMLHRDPVFLSLAVAGLVVGAGMGAILGDLAEIPQTSRRKTLWQWAFYLGLFATIAMVASLLVAHFGHRRGLIRLTLELVASIGVLALFFFVFHAVVLDLKSVLDAFGVPDIAGLAVTLIIFFVPSWIATRRVWLLYYS